MSTPESARQVVREMSGKPMVYQDMSTEAFRSAALHAGLPEIVATFVSDTDAGVARGALFEDGGARQNAASA